MNKILKHITRMSYDFIRLLYPKTCIACKKDLNHSESFLCLHCEYDLPKTNFHKEQDNIVEQTFWGRAQVERAASYFYYRKGSKYQELIHELKYKGKKHIGQYLGQKFARDLLDSDFRDVDIIVPVPLHPKKKRKRGYNQSEWIAHGIGDVLDKPVLTKNLYRKTNTSSQTKKSRFDRWENVKHVFGTKSIKRFSNQHVLLVDDVITTGATLEACINEILNCPNAKVSLISLGYSSN